MRLIGKERLDAIISVDAEIDTWISAWVAELSNANWRSAVELVDAFPRAGLVEGASYAFPVLGNEEINIKVTFNFNAGIAVIREVISK
ncbi:type II toxin-antitoxin system HigB family toxin [Vibrio vulnificus]